MLISSSKFPVISGSNYFKTVFITPLLFLLTIGGSFAQTVNGTMTDSSKMANLSAAAINYPMLRQAAISTDIMSGRNITAKFNGNPLFKAKTQLTRIGANFNLPIAQWGKNSVTASISYLHERTDLSQVESYNPQIPVRNSVINTTTIGFTASYMRIDTLFNHQVFYSASFTGLTDELSRVRIASEMLGISVPFTRTATTSFSVGLYYINNPTAPTHVIPVIAYWHQFETGNIQLFADFPSRVILKKQLSPKSWVSFGSELGGSQSFLALNQPFPHNAVSSTMEIKTRAGFEYLVSKKILLGINGGMSSTLSSRVFKQGDKQSDYFIKGSGGTVPYVNFSISFLPFLKTIINR
ncbi:hypothetical protein [Mucilaginibacter lappiensis]|uniref:Uncharacterized protein n=1 Tax=Mucilaginibacter lappiensis TaxID=354630 RepID=A0A1N7BY47_9SPHI|nr:hypothetical protein [Mucilaginibacter lappiensis]MBB6109977.1 hypothetical protein [Mucilaginibacter lappiensis]MBB6126691.1 hypothetical protein [Mucilaginibacter lappiensis]SIR56245.1 hypothetical protein SAMN05421821_108214 [Mucilaginibacter lappiensis]